jgi:hypothetical protein
MVAEQPRNEEERPLDELGKIHPGVEELYRLYLGVEAAYSQSVQATSVPSGY